MKEYYFAKLEENKQKVESLVLGKFKSLEHLKMKLEMLGNNLVWGNFVIGTLADDCESLDVEYYCDVDEKGINIYEI